MTCHSDPCGQPFGGKRFSFPSGAAHPDFIDLAGRRFGRWLVVGLSGESVSRKPKWNCVCDCGTARAVLGGSLRSGKSASCGCLAREIARAAGDRTRTHGMTHTSTYTIWMGMVARCHSPTAKDFPRYGAKGVTVCDRWRESFENFLADMGPRPAGLTLDRRENDKGYSPENCRWATYGEQVRNSRAVRLVTINGKTQCIKDWCDELGVRVGTYRGRRARGWSAERALTTPSDQTFNWRNK
jgi:hypothetical protein